MSTFIPTSLVVLYKGKRGCGKTLSMVKDGYKHYLRGWKIYSNFYTSFSTYMNEDEIVSLNEESPYFNCVIMIDEIQILFDARRSGRKQNLNFSYFIQQIRKRNIIILCASQFSNTIDMRLRQHVDILAYPSFDKLTQVCEVRYVDITSTEMDIFDIGLEKTFKIGIRIFQAQQIFPLYDTNQLIRTGIIQKEF